MKKNISAPTLRRQRREVVYATASKGRALKQSTVYVSESVRHLLTFGSGDFKQNTDLWISLVHPDDRKKIRTCWRRIARSGKGATLQYRMKPKKGEGYIWVEDKATARRDGGGKCIGVTGSVLDVTERKRLEIALEESEAHLRSIFDHATIGMYCATSEGRILKANKSLLDMLGYASLEELSGANSNDRGFGPHYSPDEFRERFEKEREIHGLESIWKGKSGRAVFAREDAYAVRDDKGRMIYYEATVEDISGHKKAEETSSRIGQILKMTSEVGQLIIRESEQDVLLDEVCKAIVAGGAYLMAWIGVLDEKSKKVIPIAWTGKEEGYLRDILVTADDRAEENGPVGTAVKLLAPSVCNDVETETSFKPWRDKALKRGFRSVATFPMRVRGNVIGLLTIYDGSRARFGEEEIRLVSEVADNIGFALWAIEVRKQQEAADEIIKDREHWLNESQRVAGIGSYIYEIDSRSWSCSSVLDELLGIDATYRRDFQSWLSLIYPDDRAPLLNEIRTYGKTGNQFSSEFRVIRAKDHEIRWMWGTGEILHSPNGTHARLFGTVQDVTDRKLAEEALAQSESLFHTSFENSSMGIALLTLDGKYRKVNAKFSEMMGYTREELADYGCRDLTLPDDTAVTDRILADAFAERPRGGTVENRYVRKDGRVIWVESSVSLVRNRRGQPDYLIANFNDVTDRKHAEEALRNEHILLRTLIDNLPNSIYVKDKEYKKTLANPANVRHSGMKYESEVLGKTDFELYPRELAENYYRDDRKVIGKGQTILVTEEYSIGSDGKRYWQLTSKIPLRDKSGTIVGLIGIGTDITERKRAEENERRERILLKALFDHLPASIWVKDRNYRRTTVNKAHVDRTALFSGRKNLSEEDFIDKTDFEIYDEETAKEFFLDDQTVIRDGKTILDREELVVDSKGERHWQLVSKVPLMDQNGEITGLIGIVTDINKQKEAEEAQERERVLLRTVIDNLPNAIFVKDSGLRKLIANSSHVRQLALLTGKRVTSEAELIGKTDDEIYAGSTVHASEDEEARILKDGVPVINREQNSFDADGRERWELVSKIPLRNENGKIIGLVGITSEITEQKRVEKALRESEEKIARITNSISDIIYSVDGATGEFEYLSSAFQKTLGYTPGDILRMGGRWTFLKSVVEGGGNMERDPIMNEMQLQRKEDASVLERWWKCKDGSKRFIEDYSVPIYEEGRLTRVDGVLRDMTERKLAEDEVERERILLRTLIDNFPYAIYVKDKNYRKVIANPVDVRHFAGLNSEAEIIGTTDFDIYPREIAERLQDDDRRVIEEGQAVVGREELVVDARGNEHWLLTTKVPLRDKEENIIGLVGVGIDVTEKRAVDEALRRSEAELRALFESMNDVVMSVDSEGRYLKIAPTNPSLLYRPAEEMTGKTVFDVLPEDSATQFLKVVREVLQDRTTHSIEYALKIGGEEKWRAASVSPMTDDSVIWVARDVTERKAMEKEITDSEKKYRELVENALVGVYKINLSGTVVYVNKAMADMLEFDSPQDMMSVSLSSLYKNVEDVADLIDELRTSGKTGKNKEVELVTKSGKVRNVLISASLDRDVISGMAKDITEIRTLEREFIQTQKLEGLGNIAAGIAHDFNNILGVILGYSDLLGQSPYEERKFGRGMQAITKSAERGKSLVRQLLTFARKTDVTFESVVLNNALAEIEKLVQETFPRTIEVRSHHEEELPPVLADVTQIHQVLLNLCVNARDAMSGGGILSLSTGVVSGTSLAYAHPEVVADRYVEISVGDTGSGMDETTRQRIFEPFFTTKGVGKGTGLGLSVVYGIIESHRGFIDVASEPGKGTIFRIFLPVLEHPIDDVDLSKDTDDEGGGSSATVLVIEDEEMLRELLRSVLSSKGHKVILAKDGDEGVMNYRDNVDKIDIVISDLGLPKLGGEEVVRRIAEIDGHAKVAVASGFISPEVRAALEKEGISRFIQKPYRTAEVVRMVSEMLLARKK